MPRFDPVLRDMEPADVARVVAGQPLAGPTLRAFFADNLSGRIHPASSLWDLTVSELTHERPPSYTARVR